MSYSFTNKIFKHGINPYVDVPLPLCDTLIEATGKRGYLPVRVLIKEVSFQTTLVPRGGGGFRLFLNGPMRKQAGADVGDTIKLTLELDEASREIEVPPDLAELFQAQPAAQMAFAQLTPHRRREILRWLLAAKKAETRTKRLQHILSFLTTGQS